MRLDDEQNRRILTPAARRLMEAIRAGGGQARIVGGAVRDVLMRRAPGDIDLAVNLPPERVMEILARQGIKVVATGLAHGTVTAVVDHAGYEITTLRRDIDTDGRHAIVAFTDDWRADAARRDFTFNALYVDCDGVIYDYFDGMADAEKGCVRFIGDARTRIREDVLRILRFFRFYAWFGCGEPEAQAVQACRELADLMPRLSAERVMRETLKLLSAPDPRAAWRLLRDVKITDFFVPEAIAVDRLDMLLDAERAHHAAPNALLRLAAVLPPDGAIAATIAARLKFSARDAATLGVYAVLPTLLRDQSAPASLRHLLYRYGIENCRAALLLSGVDRGAALPVLEAWENPTFPLRGEDLLRLGIPASPRVGDILRAVETWWIDGDFRADRAACLAQAQQYGKNH